MFLQPLSFTEDGQPDAEAVDAMRAALRDLKVEMRKGAEHPKRAEMLSLLGDARMMIDRINS